LSWDAAFDICPVLLKKMGAGNRRRPRGDTLEFAADTEGNRSAVVKRVVAVRPIVRLLRVFEIVENILVVIFNASTLSSIISLILYDTVASR